LGCFPDFADEISANRWNALPIANPVTDEKCRVSGVNQRMTSQFSAKKERFPSTANQPSLRRDSLSCQLTS
jgi:hypothetical protein